MQRWAARCRDERASLYQRVVWQREDARLRAGLPPQAVERRQQLRAPRSVNDGNGFVFIDHLGNICPSGFLPVARGNVRTASLADVYRTDDMFTRLRNANALFGKCGRCGFREICGGSRARAFAATGAVMATDPLSAYEPGPDVEPLLTYVRTAAAESGAAVGVNGCQSQPVNAWTTDSMNRSAC